MFWIFYISIVATRIDISLVFIYWDTQLSILLASQYMKNIVNEPLQPSYTPTSVNNSNFNWNYFHIQFYYHNQIDISLLTYNINVLRIFYFKILHPMSFNSFSKCPWYICLFSFKSTRTLPFSYLMLFTCTCS